MLLCIVHMKHFTVGFKLTNCFTQRQQCDANVFEMLSYSFFFLFSKYQLFWYHIPLFDCICQLIYQMALSTNIYTHEPIWDRAHIQRYINALSSHFITWKITYNIRKENKNKKEEASNKQKNIREHCLDRLHRLSYSTRFVYKFAIQMGNCICVYSFIHLWCDIIYILVSRFISFIFSNILFYFVLFFSIVHI